MTKMPDEGLYQAELAALTEAVFGGWYTDETYTTAWNPGAPVNGNLNLYAKWTETAPDPVDLSGFTLEKAMAYIKAKTLSVTTHYTFCWTGSIPWPALFTPAPT